MIFILPLVFSIFVNSSFSQTIEKQNSLRNDMIENNLSILIYIDIQKLFVFDLNSDKVIKEYSISTSKFGEGSTLGSKKTPLGKHRIKEMIGEEAKLYEIIKNRMLTGRLATVFTDSIFRESDDVTTRIMWLDGKEEENSNSLYRYIYIHGTPEEGVIGTKASHGCIRMTNIEVIELFNMVKIGTNVEIQEFYK